MISDIVARGLAAKVAGDLAEFQDDVSQALSGKADLVNGGLTGYNLTYHNETEPTEIGFVKLNSNNKMEYVPYVHNSTVSLSNVIAIVNKTYYAQTVSFTGSLLDLSDCSIYTSGQIGSGERSNKIWVLLDNVDFSDTD